MPSRSAARAFGAVVLSLLTIVGGHFVNRRWDRALLFLVLIPLMTLSVYVLLFAALNMGFVSRPSDATRLFSMASRVPLYGFAVIYVLSVVTTYWDARAQTDSFRPEWTATGRIAAVLSSVVCFALILYALTVTGLSRQHHTDTKGRTKTSVPFGGPTLYQPSLEDDEGFGGGSNGDSSQLPAPPKGDGHLNLRFSYDGRPAAGLIFRVQLDSKYYSRALTTDDQGMASLSLPAGKVYLNELSISGWQHAPEGLKAIAVRTGHEDRIPSDGEYFKYSSSFDSEGLALTASTDPQAVSMAFQIVPRIEMVWPSKHDKKTKVIAANAVIRWRPVAGAKTYLLTITGLKHDGDTTSYEHTVMRKVVGRSSFALAGVPVVESDDGAHEYSVNLTAFDANGAYLTETDAPYFNGTFVLADDMALAEDKYRPGVDSSFSPDVYERRRKDRQRMEVSSGLIEDGKYDVVARLLATVSEASKKGEWYAMQGYALAKQHRCDQAEPSLRKAESYQGDGEDKCMCGYYLYKARKLCPGK